MDQRYFCNLWMVVLLLIGSSGCQPLTSADPAEPQVQTHAEVSSKAQSTEVASRSARQPWWQDAVFYQIWPRSFADSDADGHGDFKGIQAKLPYLADLGVQAIWLTPIFAAPSYHGYDFTEFYQVETDYGSLADFRDLVQAAKQQHIRIILDLVINHISDQHAWFKRSAAGEAPFADYFIWRPDLPKDGWGPAWDATTVNPQQVWHFNAQRNAYYYAAFGASQPDLNLRHPAVVAEMKKMAKFWLDQGVAGFRLDAVRYAIENGPGQQADTAETLAYWQDFASYVRSVQPDALLVGEAWADLPIAARYAVQGKALDAGFDFEFGYKVLELLNDPANGQLQSKAEFGTMSSPAGSKTGSPTESLAEDQTSQQTAPNIASLLQANYEARLAAGAPMGYFSPFLTNHDQPRVNFQLKGHQVKAKLAAAMLLSSPGSSYLYYGEEIGLTQASDAEHIQRRAPMLWDNSAQAGFTQASSAWVQSANLFPPQQSTDWWPPFLQTQLNGGLTVAEQQADPQSLWSLYRYFIQQKHQRAEYGIAGQYHASQQGPLLKIERELAGKRSVLLLNLSNQPQAIPAELLTDSSLQPGWLEGQNTRQLAAWQLRSWHN